MELSFRQPLLSQSGTVYSQNQIVLARINANSSGDETLEELQKHLYSVAEAYWKLYRARAEFFQRQRLLTSAQNVLTTLEGRNEVDTIPRQILRARAAVARAESRMQRAVTDIRNAESQLRLLVNDPEMLDGGPVEFTPVEMPYMMASPVGLRDSLQTALVNRPDISYAIRQMRASGVRMGVSKSEMLPKLDFIVSSYVAGLQRNSQFADSFGSQFSDGRPGYTVGMEFEVPLGNRAAKAKVEQRQWELKRAISSFRLTVESSLTEVEISSREVDTAWRELLGKYQAMSAAENEVNYLQDRFAVLPMVEESSMLLLEDLLDGYERLADEEAAFAQAQTNYALSIIQLRRATGTMLRSRHDAPEIDNNESDWMHSRAEQATGDNDSLVAKKSDSREVSPVRALSGNIATKKQSTSDSLDADEKLRAAPVSLSPPPVSKTSAAAQAESSNSPSPSRKPKVGGHSFGNGF
jgi:outer membrane protein TolC